MREKFSIAVVTVLLGLLSMVMSACDQFPLILPTQTSIPPTETATYTPEPTATRVWFPATDTPLPQPTRPTMTPTPEQRPVSASVLSTDDFSQTARWSTGTTAYGSVAYGVNELTIALKEPRRSLYSFYQESMTGNYYLEMVINPSLCKGEDLYGIAFRIQDSSQFYRFTISCEGVVRIDLVQNSSVVPVAERESSGAFRPGADQDIRVAIWLFGDEVRTYINDIYQLSAYRLRWQTGGVGVFARSAGENALTVNFSDLVLRESIAFPPTPIPSETPLPPPTHTPLKQP